MIVAESIGFAGTHSICDILTGIPGVEASHGTQNFETRGPIGTPAQTPEAFVDSMLRARDAGSHPVALHTNFPPVAMKGACDTRGVRYELLVRAPERQIDSCYAWAMKKVLDGDAAVLLTAFKMAVQPAAELRLEANLPNLVYIFAARHVCTFNLTALALGAPIVQMEDVLNHESAFRSAFDLAEAGPIAHFEGEAIHRASHRADSGLQAVAEPDREAIRAALPIVVGAHRVSIEEMGKLLGY
ncbi:hypothetical protein [Albibacillus kandeliae]|uniref:hypothetical protein n=1 Tax=Albibacillus kandeliae TaxID=2174228 RepID=UPI0013005C52|nr:hypothetical protein [Albibacillus kandeliae]